jgi:hypothetical protein
VTSVRHGSAATDKAASYLQQLAKHWRHKFPVTSDAASTRIDLPSGKISMAAAPDRLRVWIAPGPEADGARLQQVFEDHINRFAFREAPLPFVWTQEEVAA